MKLEFKDKGPKIALYYALTQDALVLSLNETVLHPGHYRIALSINSRSELPPDPVAVVDANGNSVSAPFEDPAVFPVAPAVPVAPPLPDVAFGSKIGMVGSAVIARSAQW